MKKTAQDHKPKQPTQAERTAQEVAAVARNAEYQAVETAKQKEFIDKYNALCEEYSYNIVPQIGVQLQKISPSSNGVK